MPSSISVRFIPGALLILLLSACATAPQSLELTHNPPANIARNIEWVEVPFFPQSEFQCGPAALATLLNHNGLEITPNQLVDQVYIPERQGSLQIEMIATARNFGLLGYKLQPELKNILLEIDHGNPVLVFQNLALDIWPKWHYAVAVGYDLEQSVLILRSGIYKRHKVSFSTFEHTWRRANYWAYVFASVGSIPITATVVEHIKASHELMKAKGIELSVKAFRSGLERWPDNSLMLVSLANAEYSAGNWPSAIKHLQQEISLRPKNSSAWNNLAYALAANGCQDEAISAIQCAGNLAPQDNNIKHSLVELQQTKASKTGACEKVVCPVQNY